jgi:hypothetical protein
VEALICKLCREEWTAEEIETDGVCVYCWELHGDDWIFGVSPIPDDFAYIASYGVAGGSGRSSDVRIRCLYSFHAQAEVRVASAGGHVRSRPQHR